MDPALQELLDAGEADDEVAIVVRLRDAAAAPPPGLRIVARLGPVATARVQRNEIWQLYGHPAVVSLKAPRWLIAEDGTEDGGNPDDEPLIDPAEAAQIDLLDSDHRRPDGIAETGRGVVLGVIDWGCDFAHPDFVAPDGRSRLLALWDQRSNDPDGNRYGYGRIHRQAALTQALAANDPYRKAGYHPGGPPSGAHGTHVLGIAAGNGRAEGPVGLAPEAEVVFVHLGAPGWEQAGPLGDSTNLLEAIDFLVREAGERALVCNMSIGRHAGPHDGSTLVEQAIDWLLRARPGTAIVQSTGNYYARPVHGAGRLRSGETDTLAFEVHPGDTTPNELELWYPGSDVFAVRLFAPDGALAAEAALGAKAPVFAGSARVGTLYHRAKDPNNGDHHVNLFQYPNAPPGTWRLQIDGIDVADGRWHAWLERDPGCAACQARFAGADAVPSHTTGSICNALLTLAVGAIDGHDPAFPLAPFSSAGPTRDGRVRPLLVAPGVRVLSARSQPRQGQAPLLTRMSGTSMAAPHVAGTVALMYEAGGRMDIAALRRALFDSLAPLPAANERDARRIGHGRLDSAAAVRCVRAPRSAAPAPEPLNPGDAESVAAKESTMHETGSSDCCGAACATCEHCRSHDCATCPCCHPAVSGTDVQAGATGGVIDSVDSTGEPAALVQVVASPLEADIDAELAGERGDADDPPWPSAAPAPLVQVVASPFEAEDAMLGLPPLPSLEAEAPHPIDAAEALIEAGGGDANAFLSGTAAGIGAAWPPGCTARSLFDDLSGRGGTGRRQQMDRHFEVIARPGRQLAQNLQSGDIVLRRGDAGQAQAGLIAHPLLYRAHEALEQGLQLEGGRDGWYAHVVEPPLAQRPARRGADRFARRLGEPDGNVLPDTMVLRQRPAPSFDSVDEAAAPDPDTRWLQTALNRAIGAGLVVDGLFGPATRDAVRRYQQARGLLVDGIVGPQTLGALRGEAGGSSPYTPPGYAPPPYAPPPYTPPPPPYEPPRYEVPPPPPYRPPPPRYEVPPPSPYRPPPPRYEVPPSPPPYRPPPPPRYEVPPPSYRQAPPRYEPPPYAPPAYTPPAYAGGRGGVSVGARGSVGGSIGGSIGGSFRVGASAGVDDSEAEACAALDRFGYDSTALTAEHRARLQALAAQLLAERASAATLTGYASPEGTASYNLMLGQRRAEAAAAELRSLLDRLRPGAGRALQLTVRSEGEARQLGADGPSNRRVEICWQPAPPAPPAPRPPAPRPPAPRPPPVTRVLTRHDVQTPQGQAMLRRYEEAVRRLEALPANDPRSWQFQWYTHAVRPDRGKAREINTLFGSAPSARRTLALRMWDTCQAHHPGTARRFFLPWHRMYLYFMERICRGVLGDDSFAMPYWNYTSGPSPLPALCRDRRSPLFRTHRYARINNGEALEGRGPSDTFSARDALALTTYDPAGSDPSGFNGLLDNQPHGMVHTTIGNEVGMREVTWAARDPIFWLHHCNIDRVWASWNAAGRRNPTDRVWLDQRFTFADADGREVQARVGEFGAIGALGHRYDRLESVPGTPTPPREDEPADAGDTRPSAPRRRLRTRAAAAPQGGIALGGQAIQVNLRRVAPRPGESEDGDAAEAEGQRTYLLMRNYRAQTEPGVIYHVYLGLPEGTRGRAADAYWVGPLGFFNAVPHGGHGDGSQSRRFDVTALVRRLRAEGRLRDDGPLPVVIAPAGQPDARAMPVVGDISLVDE